MSHRRRSEPSPIQGGVVCRESPAVYWLVFEPLLPLTCTACPYGTVQSEAGLATCTIAGSALRNVPAKKPPCSRGDWQQRARAELAVLWERIIPSDEELAQIAADHCGAPWPLDGDAPSVG